MLVLLAPIILMASVASDHETTTQTYDIEVPGSDPIRIVEGEPLWKTTPKTRFEHRSFNVQDSTEEKKDHLREFLTTYADNVRRNKIKNRYEEDDSVGGDNEGSTDDKKKSWDLVHYNRNKNKFESDDSLDRDEDGSTEDRKKNWDLVQYPKHNHPYDDRKGWVSMEPVPWSVSKISKWQSKYKPSTQRPWEDYDTEESPPVRPAYQQRPTTNNYDIYYHDNKPQSFDSRPYYTKPTAVYSQKVHVDSTNRNHHKHDQNCKHQQQSIERPSFDDGDIITDGRPSDFPQQYESSRRHGTEIHPDSHPLSGQGDWVLLSTTKGYKYPQQRQRALQIQPDSIGTKRGVRLTVLPPLKGSKVNMTTSHGGLLQVESTFQTVEQARKQFGKKEKLKKKNQNQKKRPKPVRQVLPPTVTTTTRNSASDSSAMLAAVGAGMIPATMAMLVPMALGGRRRRAVSYGTTTQVTFPRKL